MQVNGWNQNAHYALVLALADGTPSIDETRHRMGDLGTGDVSLHDGHYYSNKAPGLAFTALPSFLVFESLGMRTTGDPTRAIWVLHLFTVAAAGVALMLLVAYVAERLEPGYGLAAGATLGLGTLVLPFATLFFAHVLSAALGFGAFALLYRERERPRAALANVAAAGALAGLAVTTEYTLALVALALGVYVLVAWRRLAHAAAFAGGVAAGVVPLLAYNLWAFGSPAAVSYDNNQVEPVEGFLGATTPDLGVLADLLVSAWGLLPNMPVLAAAAVGLVLLYRRGRRTEALLFAAIPAAHLLYSSALSFSAFGGLGLPRYVVYTLPFLAAPLALAYRAFPLTTLALAAVSVFQMAVMTATNALASYDGQALDRLRDRNVTQTGAAFVGVTGWYTILPFFGAVLVASLIAVRRPAAGARDPHDAVIAAAALAAWAVIAVSGDNPSGREFAPEYVTAVAVLLAAATAAWALAARRTRALGARGAP